jgi:hypothetical protein
MNLTEEIKAKTQEGDYWEEVQGIVEDLIRLIKCGQLTCRDEVMTQIESHVSMADHTCCDDLCAVVLKYSNHPTAYLFNNGQNAGIDDDKRRYETSKSGPAARYKTPGLSWDGGRKKFPWPLFAVDAMEEDVKEKLAENKLYADMNLPHDPPEDGEEEEGDGEEEHPGDARGGEAWGEQA